MKITILTGSAHPKGTTNTLATAFAEGAQTAGHEVFRFNCATAKVRPCIGCNQCGCGQLLLKREQQFQHFSCCSIAH